MYLCITKPFQISEESWKFPSTNYYETLASCNLKNDSRDFIRANTVYFSYMLFVENRFDKSASGLRVLFILGRKSVLFSYIENSFDKTYPFLSPLSPSTMYWQET